MTLTGDLDNVLPMSAHGDSSVKGKILGVSKDGKYSVWRLGNPLGGTDDGDPDRLVQIAPEHLYRSKQTTMDTNMFMKTLKESRKLPPNPVEGLNHHSLVQPRQDEIYTDVPKIDKSDAGTSYIFPYFRCDYTFDWAQQPKNIGTNK